MKIITSWDDGAAQDVQLAELLAKYNLPAIFYWSWAMSLSLRMTKISKWLSRPQCSEIAGRFEIGSHTMTHPELPKLSPNGIRYELTESRRRWQDFTGQPINSFCYPRGYTHPTVARLVQQAGYFDARTVIVGHLDQGSDPYNQPTTVHVGVNRKEYGTVRWQDYARQQLVRGRATPDSVYHLWGHSWEIDRENAWADLESLFKELING